MKFEDKLLARVHSVKMRDNDAIAFTVMQDGEKCDCVLERSVNNWNIELNLWVGTALWHNWYGDDMHQNGKELWDALRSHESLDFNAERKRESAKLKRIIGL